MYEMVVLEVTDVFIVCKGRGWGGCRRDVQDVKIGK